MITLKCCLNREELSEERERSTQSKWKHRKKYKKTPRSHRLRGAKSFDQWWLSPDFVKLFGSVARFQNIPVDDAPYCGEMIDTAVLIVEVVGMFPYVDAENRLQSVANGGACVGFLRNHEFPFAVTGKPYPTATEKTGAFLLELLLEGFERTKLCIDGFGQLAHGLAIFLWSGELREVEIVVEDLSGVVEDGTFGVFNDFFEGFTFEATAREQVVEVRHIGVEVLAVVELHSSRANDGLESRGGVGEFNEFEFTIYGLCISKCAGGKKSQSGMSECHNVDLLCG